MSAHAIRFGDLRRRVFTLPQAARVLNVKIGAVRKSVERGVTARYVESGGRRLRAVDGIDILYMLLSPRFSPNVRSRLYVTLKNTPEDRALSGTMAVPDPGVPGVVEVSLDQPVRDALAGIATLDEAKRSVDANGIVRGAGVEAHRISALADGGMSRNDILRDYPDLTPAMFDAAIAYARAHPKQGRPFPSRTVKSVLRDGTGGLESAFAAARSR